TVVSLVNKPTLNSDDCKLPLARRRPCLTDWIGYQMKCFYFSDKEETWSASQDFCSLYNASLAVIEKEEMAFVQRYKGSTSHWIGLQRDPKQPWKWVNGNVKVLGVWGRNHRVRYSIPVIDHSAAEVVFLTIKFGAVYLEFVSIVCSCIVMG
uniref:C-type lectin domain-containing protein n=1 Tax=Naja naja TaxID=35670 RepID=A0A8C6V8T8_NAJNA